MHADRTPPSKFVIHRRFRISFQRLNLQLGAMLRQAASKLRSHAAFSAAGQRLYASAAAAAHPAETRASNKFYDVPEGHQNSDLSSVACNVSLTRRKDVCMRQDLSLAVDGKDYKLAELLRGHKAVMFGVPDRGSVCSEQQLPGYVREADKLRAAGVTRVLCVTVGSAAQADEWAKQLKLDSSKVQVAADTNQGLTRFLGMELAPAGQPGPHSMRWAALVDDGILLKVKVEQSPADCKVTSAAAMAELAKTCLAKP